MSGADSSSHPAAPYPAAYPSPSMSAMPAPSSQYSSYALPEAPGQSTAQAGANNMQALNLPPIRSGDGGPQVQQQSPPPPLPQQQQQQQAQAGQPPSMQYYIAPGQSYPGQSGDANAHMRFGSIPIPPADPRIMSGGRHKKEIKRRTKTGCLTCRKRRIKCDEQHPACRNCQKSKRDCLGYDPIFKPQPGPPPIQPALGAAPMHHTSQHTPPYPQGYAASYPGYPPQPTASENSTSEANDYGAAIDPALGGTMAQTGEGGAEQGGHRAKRTKIEDLLCINGFPPPQPTPSQPIPDTLKDQMKQIWSTVYAPGIDKFLETTWYVSRGEIHLLANQKMCEQFVSLIYRFQAIPQNDPNYPIHLAATYSLEAKMIWQMISMCRTVANPMKNEGAAEPEVNVEDVKNGLNDAVKRMDIFEALVTGEYLSSEDVPSSTGEAKSNGTALGDQLKTREKQFWNLIHTFLTIRDDEASAAKEIDDTISSARSLLDSRENRDVIYSIMIARHIGARIAEFPDNLPQPTSNEEADNKNKLHVAKRFIEDEANGKGTNQIVQRLCGMAARSWGQRR